MFEKNDGTLFQFLRTIHWTERQNRPGVRLFKNNLHMKPKVLEQYVLLRPRLKGPSLDGSPDY